VSFLFDSSAIFKAIKENTVETLLGNNTLELTRYELGNVLWKESTLHKRLTNDESKKLVRLVKQVLNIMQVLEVGCHEEAILDAAQRLKLTFYDASYVFYARERNLTLVTEDEPLTQKARTHIRTLKLDDLKRHTP
jgi:predicted nucleic acid-binding protein